MIRKSLCNWCKKSDGSCEHMLSSTFSSTGGNAPVVIDCSLYDPKTPAPVADNVNHPAHYESGKYECIDVMVEALGADVVKGFCLGNAFEYLYRCQKKHDSPTEDVAKAKWYINKYLELENTNETD